MSPRVFVTRRLPGPALGRLGASAQVDVWPGSDEPGPAELAERARSVEGLLCMLTDRVDAALLDAAPRLRVVSTYAVGTDNIDVAECTRRGIAVGHTPGVLTAATADLTWALILATMRRVVEAADAVRAGEWTTWQPEWLLGQDLDGAVLGIVGYGSIGRAVAARAVGFGMQVRWIGSGAGRTELHELLAASDVVSLHCPLNQSTRGLIGTAELALMKPSAVLINTARGPVVDQDALTAALAGGAIGAAGLDVSVIEPIDPGDPLLSLANCVVLPHIGSATVGTRARMAEMAVDNLLAGLRREPLPHPVPAGGGGSR